ncbi:hypothetical protein CSA56_08380 [candidate division KSB3 bacterium]|uniref:Uncharacterized protein n=1 Tax=candidate division KSB3 bacterium TaxID=2044937 RepID=A0A2G6KET2_9BACT|nr:MAG: hypothetical protein CSA56_08380 [candidate division KSB3 bacterium]
MVGYQYAPKSLVKFFYFYEKESRLKSFFSLTKGYISPIIYDKNIFWIIVKYYKDEAEPGFVYVPCTFCGQNY